MQGADRDDWAEWLDQKFFQVLRAYHLPYEVCRLVLSFLPPLQPLRLSSPGSSVVDPTTGTLTLPRPVGEVSVVLDTPRLVGHNFQLEFDLDMEIDATADVGHHGGLLIGAPTKKTNRWDAADPGKATCCVVDWIDYRPNRSDGGFRVFGASKATCLQGTAALARSVPRPPRHWVLQVVRVGFAPICFFYADGQFVHRFEPVHTDGYLGFWTNSGVKLTVSNLSLSKLYSPPKEFKNECELVVDNWAEWLDQRIFQLLQWCNLPQDLGLLVMQFMGPLQPIQVSHTLRDSSNGHFTIDPESGTLEMAHSGGEYGVVLDTPYLTGPGVQLEFDFEMDIRADADVGRHGGVIFGALSKRVSRWDGHSAKEQGARCTVVDWLDRSPGRLDAGFRVYGASQATCTAGTLSTAKHEPKPPRHWMLQFFKVGSQELCILFADGKLIHRFEPVRSEGYIGFWVYKGVRASVSNLVISRIATSPLHPLLIGYSEPEGLATAMNGQLSLTTLSAHVPQGDGTYRLPVAPEALVLLSEPRISEPCQLSFRLDYVDAENAKKGCLIFGSPEFASFAPDRVFRVEFAEVGTPSLWEIIFSENPTPKVECWGDGSLVGVFHPTHFRGYIGFQCFQGVSMHVFDLHISGSSSSSCSSPSSSF